MDRCRDCFPGHRCWLYLHFRISFALFKLHGDFGLHLESWASGRKTCVCCGKTWGKCTLTGNRTATCSISECQRIHSGTSVKPMASILRRLTTQLCRPRVPTKRMAIVLHWLAQASSYSKLAAMYAIGKSTVAEIVHHHSSRQACYRGNSFPNWARIGPGDGRF